MNSNRKPSWVKVAGITLIAMSVVLLLLTFQSLIFAEIRYRLLPDNSEKEILSKSEALSIPDAGKKKILIPESEDFGIVIPKIFANSRIIADVDPFNPSEYQNALARGIAHAKGSSFPNQKGNVFLFSHSGANFYEANRFNADFYLLNEMESGDSVFLFYHGEKMRYTVKEKKIVSGDSVELMNGDPEKKMLTLMTCWPPGTSVRRLIVVGELNQDL